jgi:hypothetical protein
VQLLHVRLPAGIAAPLHDFARALGVPSMGSGRTHLPKDAASCHEKFMKL